MTCAEPLSVRQLCAASCLQAREQAPHPLLRAAGMMMQQHAGSSTKGPQPPLYLAAGLTMLLLRLLQQGRSPLQASTA